jgi:surface polysaccharide O-acyltransferase-like enzyme
MACLPFWDGIWYDWPPEILSLSPLGFPLTNVGIYLYRQLIGMAACVFFFALFQKIYRDKKIFRSLSHIGLYTMEIYILQVLLLEHILTNLLNFPYLNVWVYSFAVGLPTALVLLALEFGIVKLVYRSGPLGLALFGRDYRKGL